MLSALASTRTVADAIRLKRIGDARRVVADAVKIVPNTAEDALYVHADHLGAPQKMTDASAAVVWDAAVTPFGIEDTITGTATNNQRFPGQYADAVSGLHYNWHRHYDPSTGRYVTSDPVGLQGGLNTYAYVGGNPVMYVDPEGLLTFSLGFDVSLPAWLTKHFNRDGVPIAGGSFGIAFSLPFGSNQCGCSKPELQFGGFASATAGANAIGAVFSAGPEIGVFACNLSDLGGEGYELQGNVRWSRKIGQGVKVYSTD